MDKGRNPAQASLKKWTKKWMKYGPYKENSGLSSQVENWNDEGG
jgi:hypothetical protein